MTRSLLNLDFEIAVRASATMCRRRGLFLLVSPFREFYFFMSDLAKQLICPIFTVGEDNQYVSRLSCIDPDFITRVEFKISEKVSCLLPT